MKVIYSHKILPHVYKPFDDIFYDVAKKSIECAKKFYKTKLYCDLESKDLFEKKGLVFDEIEILPEIQNYKGSIFSVPKILTMIHETEPYIHIDFDVLLFDKLNVKKDVTFGYSDVDFIKFPHLHVIDDITSKYVKPFKEYFIECFKNENYGSWSWNLIPNNCVIVVKNPKIVSDIYTDILEKVNGIIDIEITDGNINAGYAMFIEQYMLGNKLLESDIEFDFVYENGNNFPFYNEECLDSPFMDNKFIHLQGFNTKKNMTKKVLNKINNNE
jgi:hypothetical protein